MLIILFYLLVVICPILFWFWFFIWEDRVDPEPKKVLIQIFLIGAGVAVFAATIEESIFRIGLRFPESSLIEFIMAKNVPLTTFIELFFAGLIEETLKFLALREFAYSKTEFNQIADGLIYGVSLALGFVFIENSFYFYELYTTFSGSGFAIGVILRGIISTLLHITAAGIIGYSLGKKKFSQKHSNKIIIAGLFIAVLLHGTFNVLLIFENGILVAIPLVLFAFIYLLILLNKQETKTIWKLVSVKKSSSVLPVNNA